MHTHNHTYTTYTSYSIGNQYRYVYVYLRNVIQRCMAMGLLLLLCAFLNGESLIWFIYQFEQEDIAINYCQTQGSLGGATEDQAFEYVCSILDGSSVTFGALRKPPLNLHDSRTMPPLMRFVVSTDARNVGICCIPLQSASQGFSRDVLRPPRT
jgi:hypothetical protein